MYVIQCNDDAVKYNTAVNVNDNDDCSKGEKCMTKRRVESFRAAASQNDRFNTTRVQCGIQISQK